MKDEDIAGILAKESEEYRRVSDEHRGFDEQLKELDKKLHLTSEEEIERKHIQKLKLAKKDQMAEIIREYKKMHSVN